MLISYPQLGEFLSDSGMPELTYSLDVLVVYINYSMAFVSTHRLIRLALYTAGTFRSASVFISLICFLCYRSVSLLNNIFIRRAVSMHYY